MQEAIDKIQKAIDEIRQNGEHHAEFVRLNGELVISGLEMALEILQNLPSAQPEKGYTKADYIMALHKEYGCDFVTAEKAHDMALEYLRSMSKMKG